jgi:hypothetical protein
MKTLSVLAFLVITCLVVKAQNESPIPRISKNLTDYFSFYPKEKIFITTDKQNYKPGETIWFNAVVPNVQIPASQSQELTVKIYNKKGEFITGDKFQMNNGTAPGDLQIPDQLSGDQYFMVAYTSMVIDPEEVFCTMLTIDPAYNNQWIASLTARDSISMGGQKNELFIRLRELSGDILKNTSFHYQLMNGKEIIANGKLKTDENGSSVLSFTLPVKSNGEPFICQLADNKDEWKKEFFLPSNLDPLVVNFYPEGGSIVAGVPTKIGLTAYNKWGMPVNIEGPLVNQEGKQVGMVKTFTKGLGLFPVENDGKQKLKLIISGKTGQNQTFELPTTNATGLAFSVAKTDLDFISVNLVFADKLKHAIALTATSGSNLFWAADMEINGIGRIKIPTENLPQGINLLSVFSNDRKLLASRLVFVDKKQLLKVVVLPEKNNLKQGERMKLKIRLTDENNQPVSGYVSVSIADSFRKNETAPQIGQFMLSGAGLENPFSLIADAFKEQITNTALLDVFLIANRLLDLDWQKVMQFNPGNMVDNNNPNTRISGLVTDKNGNKINKAKVSLVNNKNMQLLTTTTNSDGQFSFPNMSTTNKNDFSVKATDPEGKRELNIVLSKNFDDCIGEYITGMSKKSMLLSNRVMDEFTYFRNNPDLFDKAPKLSKPNTVASDNQKMMLNSSTNLMDVIKTMKPFKLVNNQIVFIGSENSFNYQGGALIVMDGQQMGTDISIIQSISPIDVDHINVSTNPMDIQRYTGLNSVGVIEIFLKKGTALPGSTKAVTTIQYNGEYRVPKVFPTESPNPKRDFRTTLQWIPELKVDETGLAEVSVTAGKVLSDFIIEAQGIAINGRMGSGKAAFKVEK